MRLETAEARELPAFMTAEHVAVLLGVRRRTVYDWVDRGLLPCHRVGERLIRFTPSDVEEFLERSRSASNEAPGVGLARAPGRG